jgi:ATP-dependent DNA helicase RecQ
MLHGMNTANRAAQEGLETSLGASGRRGRSATPPTASPRGRPAQHRPPQAAQARLMLALREVFGLDALRPGQQEVIERVLDGKSTLAVMPTGSGKSLCYQLPALLLPGITLVVSPLIALMKDQCDKLQAHGVGAVELHSGLAADERDAALDALLRGAARVVLVTPERLADDEFLALMQGRAVSLAVVDEAHCISEWGHDFRPAFMQIGPALKRLGAPPVLALTATAPPDVAAEITKRLRIPATGVVDLGVWRPNLRYGVEIAEDGDEKLQKLRALVRQTEGAGIVYTATVRAATEVHAALRADGIEVALYHGKLKTAERHRAQEAFMQGETRVMVATNAFGMGIDKADVRFVVHFQLPGSLDAYYQESGRAGRDGEPATCTLLYARRDKAVQHFFIGGLGFTAHDLQSVLAALSEGPEGGAATAADIQQRARLPSGKVSAVLALLQRERCCERVRVEGRLAWRLARSGRRQRGIDEVLQAEQERHAEDQHKLQAMIDYAESGGCRWQALTEALRAQTAMQSCGRCDNCERIGRLQAERLAEAAECAAQFAPQSAAKFAGTAADVAAGESVAADIAAATGALRQPVVAAVPTVAAVAPVAPVAERAAFEADDAVRVKRFGAGTVVTAAADAIVVRFSDGSERSFLPEFVRPQSRRRRADGAAARA